MWRRHFVFLVWGGEKIHFYGARFVIIICSKQNFLGATNFGGNRKIEGHCTECPPWLRRAAADNEKGLLVQCCCKTRRQQKQQKPQNMKKQSVYSQETHWNLKFILHFNTYKSYQN